MEIILPLLVVWGLIYLFNIGKSRNTINEGIGRVVNGKVKCSECLGSIPQEARKCMHCGSEQTLPTERNEPTVKEELSKVNCRKCSRLIPIEALICTYCSSYQRVIY